MPTPPKPLPAPLAERTAFGLADARRLGVHRGRMYRKDLERPFHGVRAMAAPNTVDERCHAYLPRLRAGQFFSHTTAALLHGLPMSLRIEQDPTLHVSAIRPVQPPRTAGVIGHQLAGRPGLLGWVGDLPTTTVEESWCLLGVSLGRDALVVAGDYLIRSGIDDPARVQTDLRTGLAQTRRIGIARLEAALALIRPGTRSPMETLLRLRIIDAHLPEPDVNVRIFRPDGSYVGEGDLVYRRERLVIEYEGEGHRTDVGQFRYDIRRRERFEDAGWSVLRVTADDLFVNKQELVARIRARLARM